MKRYIPNPDDVARYGFEWAGARLKDSKVVPLSRLVVQRTAHINHTRVISVYTDRAETQIYVSPTGRVRVFINGQQAKRG